MNQSESINELATALAKAQGEIRNAPKDSTNPHYKAKYADLASVWNVAREPLSKHGLSVIQLTGGGPTAITITTRLMHSSGQWVESCLSMEPVSRQPGQKITPQDVGSCITYARRYGLSAMVGVAPDDDDDAVLASTPQQKQATPRQGNVTNLRHESKSNELSEILALQKELGLSNDELARVCEISTLRGLSASDESAALDKLKAIRREMSEAATPY